MTGGDWTYGRIDQDIQDYARDIYPNREDLGPRTAMENTLQRKRDQGGRVLGKTKADVVHPNNPRGKEWRLNLLLVVLVAGVLVGFYFLAK